MRPRLCAVPTIFAGFAVLLMSLLPGCSHQPLPGVRIDPITTFSLGSAKFTPFKTRPTAQQLLAAALRLYDSFDTVAVTAKLHDPAPNLEYRAVRPDKELTTGMTVTVRNGKTAFCYAPKNRHYIVLSTTRQEQGMPVARWLGLTQDPFSSVRLLSDQSIGGVEVYVLELQAPGKLGKHGEIPPQKILIYLGKNDLLPRKKEITVVATPSLYGQPEDVITEDFLGFVANSKLPDDLFPTKPPKGAKLSHGNMLVVN